MLKDHPQVHDLTGKVFGRWTVLCLHSTPPSRWECQCSCGNKAVVFAANLVRGLSCSCGCLKAETTGNRSRKHGLSKTKEYYKTAKAKRRERERQLETVWTASMGRFLRELQPTCVVCGISNQQHTEKYGKPLEIDHVNPLCKGGILQPGNAVILCRTCNSKKNSKTLHELPWEWAQPIMQKAWAFEFMWGYFQATGKMWGQE